MDAQALLAWARGTGLEIASYVFLAGMLLRFFEIFMLGRKNTLAETRASGIGAGIRTIFSRSLPADKATLQRSMYTIVAGYIFHIGLFIVLFFLAPHIELYEAVFGLSWKALPTPAVDFAVVLSLMALLAILWHRITSPVLKLLTTPQDYLVWALTFIPLLTGYMSYHHLLFNYTWLLAVHILSVDLLLVLFPFTKLTHAFTLFISRYYNGMVAGQKGVQQ